MTGPLQIVLGTISVLFLIVSSVLAYRAVRAMVRIIRTGQPDGTRFGPAKDRFKTLAIESLGHTRMLKWSTIGVAGLGTFVGLCAPMSLDTSWALHACAAGPSRRVSVSADHSGRHCAGCRCRRPAPRR